MDEIPAASAFAPGDQSEKPPVSWTIPHTEITLTRMTKGPKAGCFLFSSSTVERAEEFYKKTQHLPYRRQVPLKNFAEMRVYMAPSGWLISPHFISRFPAWLKHGIYQQAIWKWIALLRVILVNIFIVIFGLRYETTDDQMRFLLAGLRTMLLAHPRVADTEPRVRFAGFGDYSLNVEIRVDINTGELTKFREIREEILLAQIK